jgi:predicted enzyme related to lactoylglutathione lyase
MPRVTHFEFNADDPERAAKFYENVFGWKIKKWEGPIDYWVVNTGEKDTPGIDGGIMKRIDHETTIVNIDVSDVDEFVKKIEEAGGKVVKPKEAIPGVGYFAYCSDTEGNLFGIMQEDHNAK